MRLFHKEMHQSVNNIKSNLLIMYFETTNQSSSKYGIKLALIEKNIN